MEDQNSRPPLPTGTLTFLFSDIEGSTRLVQTLGDGYTPVLERHQQILRDAFGGSGFEVVTEGDSFFVVFKSAVTAVSAAATAQRAIAAEPWADGVGELRVRMGLHTGEGTLGGDNYVGLDVHRAARIGAAAHGGQVLLSDATATVVRGSLPADFQLRELGEYRLKDLDAPERLIQLVVDGLPADFPPPRTLDTPSNLPAQLTAFIGRESEAREVIRLVGESRLVTLSGPGGTGKTRLSLEVAQRLLAEFPDGVFFVDLSALTDPALVPASIAAALGIREEPDKSVLASVQAFLRDRSVLLLLDNFEQLEPGASLVGALLTAAPRMKAIVTSREVLHIRGEQEYAVQPLRLPDLSALPPLDALSQYDAVALFIRRAQAVRADFAVDNINAPAVAAICARLDGLPLAIELAAARIKVLSPDAILSRLGQSLSLLASASRDLTERQRTLRGAIDWSYQLLQPDERQLFARLGVFVGGCTIEAAEAICDPDGALGVDMLDALSSLVDKSLLRQAAASDSEPRFSMLETVREYALERLNAEADGQPVRRRHEDYFARLATTGGAEIMGARQKEWLARLDADRDNLRAGLQRLTDDGEVASALDMAASQWRYWQMRSSLSEGRATLDALLARPDAQAPTEARARALSGLGGLAYWQSDMTGAERAYTEELAIERSIDDPLGLIEAIYNIGYVWGLSGRATEARAAHEEALQIATSLDDRAWILRLRESVAFLLFHEGDYEAAQKMQEEHVAAFRAAGESFRAAIGTGFLSYVDAKQGRYDEARALQLGALTTFRQAGDMHWTARILILAAASAVVAGDIETAARLCGAFDVVREPLGDLATPVKTLGLPDPAEESRQALGDEVYLRLYAAGRAMSLDEVAALLAEAR